MISVLLIVISENSQDFAHIDPDLEQRYEDLVESVGLHAGIVATPASELKMSDSD